MHRYRIALILMLCLPLFGCFEDPVREHVHLTLRGAGPVIVTVVQEVADPRLAEGNEELADRMEESRTTIESNLDPWSRRFALQQPLAEHRSTQWVEGDLRRSVHSAVLASFDEVVEMVGADGLTGNLEEAGGVAEVSFFPTGGSRATYTQRQEAERLLVEWSDTLAAYFESVIDLYAYLGSRPDRAVPCFAHIFDTHAGITASGPLEEEEEELVLRIKNALDAVVLVLVVPEGDSFSMNELTRLVYDPFPARLTVSVDGRVLQSDGWIADSGFFERPAVDAWNALISLDGRWLAPDLVTAMVSPAPEDLQPEPDPVEFASRPRYVAAAPTSAEVESALLSALVPADELTLRWRPPDLPPANSFNEEPNWTVVMTEAEASVPD
jgi:hypothetical protein